MRNNAFIRIIVALGVVLALTLVLVMIFYHGDKTPIITVVMVASVIAGTQLLSVKVSIDNAEKLERVGDKIEVTTGKIEENTAKTELTHQIVNSRMDEFKQALEDLAAMKAEIVAVKAELAAANELARGITIGREQAAQENA